MGLDIVAYSKIELLEILDDVEDWEEKYYLPGTGKKETAYIYPSLLAPEWPFHEWAEGLEAGGVYRINGEKHSFRAGSYSGYYHWRVWLSNLALGVNPDLIWKDAKSFIEKPFYRLVNFSDCEGIISSKFAKGLAQDFAQFQEKVDAAACKPWLKKAYANWRKAFELAADNGYVDFH